MLLNNQITKPIAQHSTTALSSFFQPKLTINDRNDEYEKEADAMADKVMRMKQPFIQAKPLPITPVQLKCAHCEEEEKEAQRKEMNSNEVSADHTLESYINNLNQNGQSLPNEVRGYYEPRFGYDFSNVKVHTDPVAAKSAQSINALAYTSGNNIVFNSGQFSPDTDSGKRLLGHELTHVVQQNHIGQSTTVQKQAAPSRSAPQGLRFDVMGNDYPVNRSFAQAAALEPSIDLHVTSLSNLVGQMSNYAGTGNDRCVQEVNFWNHGSPGGQDIAGTEEIVRRDGTRYRMLNQRLSLDWLLTQGNLSTLQRFRNLFCCNGIMRWLGCGTSGVTADGGLRGSREVERPGPGGRDYNLRYERFGNRYQSVDDATAHGARLHGAQFGFLNAQSWANATCVNVMANNDFTYMGPSVSGHHYQPGFGGSFQTFHPATGSCSCDQESGRVHSNWTIEEGRRFMESETSRLLGPDHLWHLHLRTFRTLQRDADRNRDQLNNVLRMLLTVIHPRLTIPGNLPVGLFTPWVNANVRIRDWSGVTMPQMVFCHPDNCWLWIAFNQHFLQTTPEYTIQSVNHELLHAGDIWTAAQNYQRSNGNPPSNPNPALCHPNRRVETWTNAFGDYVRSFIQFYNQGLTPQRHTDIYAEGVRSQIGGMTKGEIIQWFGAMLTEVPPSLPAATRMPAEDVIAPYFTNPSPTLDPLRNEIANQLVSRTRTYILDEAASEEATRVRRQKAITLLNHFRRIWLTRQDIYRLLVRASRDE